MARKQSNQTPLDAHAMVMLTAGEKQRLKDYAASLDRTVSNLLRLLVLKELRERAPIAEEGVGKRAAA